MGYQCDTEIESKSFYTFQRQRNDFATYKSYRFGIEAIPILR
jgi:hypothetical protein